LTELQLSTQSTTHTYRVKSLSADDVDPSGAGDDDEGAAEDDGQEGLSSEDEDMNGAAGAAGAGEESDEESDQQQLGSTGPPGSSDDAQDEDQEDDDADDADAIRRAAARQAGHTGRAEKQAAAEAKKPPNTFAAAFAKLMEPSAGAPAKAKPGKEEVAGAAAGAASGIPILSVGSCASHAALGWQHTSHVLVQQVPLSCAALPPSLA
jgi:hypothetical protein